MLRCVSGLGSGFSIIHYVYAFGKQFIYYVNLSMQYMEISSAVKIKNFPGEVLIFFLFLHQNIDCGYLLEPPRHGGSNEYPQSMFWCKNKTKRYTPAYHSFAI